MNRLSLRRLLPALLVLLGCLSIGWVETVLRPVYSIKSGLKILIFLGCGALYMLITGDRTPLTVFRRPDRRSIAAAALLAAGTLTAILGGYALLSRWLDLSAIPGSLSEKEGITAATFPLVALYISFGNSLLEEFFFRGFAFLSLKKAGFSLFAWVFSALSFALYHVCIMGSWFHPVLFLLLTAGLAAAGLLFSWLDRKGSIWPAWLVHMAANLAINAIGLSLFGLL